MLILTTIIGFVLRLIKINQSFWLDEAAQYFESQVSLTKQWYLPATFHPPLFHYLTNIWVRFAGKNESLLRLLPVFIGLASILVTYHLVKIIFHKEKLISLITVALLSTSPLHVYYSQEFRPYILSVLLASLSSLYFFKFLQSKKILSLGYIITSALSLYSLYTLIFLGVSQFFCTLLFQKKKFLSLIKNQLIVFLTFVPWLPFLFVQFKNGQNLTQNLQGWGSVVSTPIFKSLPLIFVKFCLGPVRPINNYHYLILSAILFFTFCFFIFKSFKSKYKKKILELNLYLAIPLVLAFTFSLFVPIISPKRMLFLLPLFYLLVALGINSIQTLKFRNTAVVLCLIFNLICLSVYYQNPRFQRENWREAVKIVEEKTSQKSLIIFNFPEPFAPFRFYQTKKNDTLGAVRNFQFDSASEERIQNRAQGKDRVFLFDYLSGLTDPKRKSKKTVEELGFINTQTYDFSGVGFIFEFIKKE